MNTLFIILVILSFTAVIGWLFWKLELIDSQNGREK